MSDSLQIGRLSARRRWSDRITKQVIGLGGGVVIGAITLIFGYLLWVVSPLLLPGSIEAPTGFNVAERESVLVDVSENGEVFLRISKSGIVEFYNAASGQPLAAFALNKTIRLAKRVYPTVDLYALVDEDDQLSFVSTEFTVSFNDAGREITPTLKFPYADSTLALDRADIVDVALFDDQLKIVSTHNGANRYSVNTYDNVETGFPLEVPQKIEIGAPEPIQELLLGPRNESIFAFDVTGGVTISSSQGKQEGRTQMLSDGPAQVIAPLLGRYSIMLGHGSELDQWGLFRTALGYEFKRMRGFEIEAPVTRIIAEPRRKGFLSLDTKQNLALHYPTTGSTIDVLASNLNAASVAAISPRSNRLLVASTPGRLESFALHNEHPEISLASLWGEIWYEGYEEPIYSWQSSSADNDFEPKFSLTPLAFGTLKAAFYALLFAVPIAIMGAIYTAYFMAPAMRAWVKPSIEIMAALPTVILGFIGGLWLAPIIESYLSSVLSIFVLLPLILFSFALLWSQLPHKFTHFYKGWYGLLVTPIIVVTIYSAFGLGPFFEEQFFGGDSKTWFREVLGLAYDQRNALVVGIVMGLAVIPTIFSIAEDAIYGVPTHLINGSLALGATPWQTLMRVVMLTASPGIFSAVMIGMGRGVGETMIVLMATGNTPLMDFNIFEGMRTFAANIAVELPEAEVNSSHYRILFLAALVLFLLTFVFNTFAEIVRQRLRNRYGSL